MRAGARHVRNGPPSWWARLGLWLAAIALWTQSALVAAPLMHEVRDASMAAVELKALFGPQALVCAEADSPGAPPHSSDAHDQCGGCQLAAAAFDAPADQRLASPARARWARLEIVSTRAEPLARGVFPFLARGPPSPT